MEFQTKYNRMQQKAEKNSGEKITETAGYIPSKVRIENLMLAGLRLKEYRMEQFDFQEHQVDDSYFDPTRSKNFDLADISAMRRDLEERNKAKKAEAKKAQEEALKASQKAQEDQKEASKTKKGEKTPE